MLWGIAMFFYRDEGCAAAAIAAKTGKEYRHMIMKKKRLFGIVFTLALTMGLMFAMSQAVYGAEGLAHTHAIGEGEQAQIITFTPWTDALAKEQEGPEATADTCLPSMPGDYYLTEDVTLDNTWVANGETNL